MRVLALALVSPGWKRSSGSLRAAAPHNHNGAGASASVLCAGKLLPGQDG